MRTSNKISGSRCPGPRGRPAKAGSDRKLLSILIVAMMIFAGFAMLKASENAQALDFVETLTVPWPATFTPLDSAWDDTGNHAIVVGEDSAQSSNAWHYNAASGEWAQVTVAGSGSSAATWYVGLGAGNHSATIQGGVNMASPGDTVHVWPGTYVENVQVAKAINLVSHDRDSTIIDGSGGSGHGIFIYTGGVSVSGFWVKNVPPSYYGIYVEDVEDVSVTHCWLDGNTMGLAIISSQRITVSGNTMTGNTWGIYLYSSYYCTVSNNIVHGNPNYGISLDYYSEWNELLNNTVTNNNWGISFEQYCSSNLVKWNTITGNTDYGIRVAESTSNTFTRNTLDNNNRGLWLMDNSCTGNQIYQNNLLRAYGNPAQWMASDPTSNLNSWHVGDPASGGKGGNYYQGYGGTDRGDGIGSVQFIIFGGSCTDQYPWMESNGWIPYFEKIVDKNALSIMVNNDTKNEQKTPSMAIGPDGSINIVWEDRRTTSYDIYFAKSMDGGKTFPFNTKISDTTGLTDELSPKIAIDSSGVIYVVWQDKRFDSNGDIFFSKSMDGGTTFSANLQLTSTGSQGWPSVAVYGSNVYVVWHHNPGTNFDIYFMSSTNGGNSWSAQSKIDHSASGDQTYPSIAIGNTGEIFIVWHDNRGGNFDIYFTKSTDGGNSFTTPDIRVNGATTNDQLYPRIAANSDGIHVVWQDYGTNPSYPTINYTKSTNLGSSFISPSKVINTLGSTVNSAPSIALAPNGKIYIAWQRNNNLLLSWSVNAGGTFLAERLYTQHTQSRQSPSIGVDQSGRLFATWHITTFEIFCVEHTGAYLTIQPAINAAPTGGTVRVMPGTYLEQPTINKQLTLVGQGRGNTIVDGSSVGNVITVSANNVNIADMTVRNAHMSNGNAIKISFTYGYCRVSNVEMYNGFWGVGAGEPGYNIIENCSIYAEICVQLEYAHVSKVSNSTLQSSSNVYAAIGIISSGNCIIAGNTIISSEYGIHMESSDSNIITNNTFQSNNYGVFIDSGDGNTFFHNNFIGNTVHVEDWSGSSSWFQALPIGGNHWDTYSGSDANGDGIGDLPFSFTGGTDNYPWMQENGWNLPLSSPALPLRGVTWDPVGGRFWLCGDSGGESTVCYIDPLQGFTVMVSVPGAPSISLASIATDYLGNVLVGGTSGDTIHYYDGIGWHEIHSGNPVGFEALAIDFNPNDGRFYLAGYEDSPAVMAFYYTEPVPLMGGGSFYRYDAPGLTRDVIMRSIAWNYLHDYGIAVGDGGQAVKVWPYSYYGDGTMHYQNITSPATNEFYDISWDSNGWNEAAIVGRNQTFGNYWRYYDTNPQLIQGYRSPSSGTMYRTCAFKPPSSPKWVLIPHSGGGVKINVEEKYEGGEIVISMLKPNIFDMRMFLASDLSETDVLNMQVDAGTNYTFFIEGNYTGGWDSVDIIITAWQDRGKFGDQSAPGGWNAMNRTGQFNLTYRPSTDTGTMHYPLPENGVSEFYIASARSVSGQGPDGSRHHVYITVHFGTQTRAATGAMNPAMDVRDVNQAFNDINTWDVSIRLLDRNVPSSYDLTHDEFGIKEYAWVSATGTPGGSTPPGATNIHLSSSFINYSTNTNHSITVSIPNLHKDGNPLSPMIAADRLAIQNTMATAAYSDVSSQQAFPGPNMPLFIWGKSAGPVLIQAPYNGTRSAGPFTDYSETYAVLTVLDWWLVEVPASTPEGTYWGTITMTLGY